MQRLFSMFPQGGPGIALILLRLSVAGIFLFQFWTRFGALLPGWILFVVGIVALSLVAGLFTPILCVLVCLAEIYNLMHANAGGAAYRREHAPRWRARPEP